MGTAFSAKARLSSRQDLPGWTRFSADRSRLQGGGLNFLDHVCFDDISDFHVGEVFEADSTFKARLYLRHVILETSQRTNLSLMYDHIVPEQTHVGIAPYHSVENV